MLGAMSSNHDGEEEDQSRSKKKKDRERRRRSRSRSRSKSPKRERRSAWDDPTGESTPFNGTSMLQAPSVQSAPDTAASSSGFAPGTAAFLTSAAQASLARIYVGNIVFDIEEPDVRALFERCGPIKSIQMTRDPGATRHRGFCFIEFETLDGAEVAIAAMNGYQLAGRNLRVGRPHNPAASITPNIQASVPALQPILLPQTDEIATQHHLPQMKSSKMCTPGEPRTPSGYPLKGEPKVYVANVPSSVPESIISDLFGGIGRIKALRTEPYPDDKDKKFSVVEYEDDTSAERAVSKYHNHKLGSLRLKVGRLLPIAAAQNTLIFRQVQQVAQMRLAGLPIPSNFGLNQMSHMHFNPTPLPPVDGIYEDTMNISTGSARVALMHKLLRKDEAATLRPPPTPHNVVFGREMPSAMAHPMQPHLAPPPPPAAWTPDAGEVQVPTRCVVLTNLVGSPSEVDDELSAEVKEECSKYGGVEHLLIFDEEDLRTKRVEVKFFILYSNIGGALKAVEKLHNRYFAKRRIACRFYNEARFRKLLTE